MKTKEKKIIEKIKDWIRFDFHWWSKRYESEIVVMILLLFLLFLAAKGVKVL